MDQNRLRPNPPSQQQSPGNRSPRQPPRLSSPHLHPRGALTTPQASTSAPRPPTSARSSLATAADINHADWSVPTHSRSPLPTSSSSGMRGSTSVSVPSTSGMATATSASALTAGGLGRVYRSDGLRVSNHGLHTGHAVPSYLGVLSPPAEDAIYGRVPASAGRRTTSSMPQVAMSGVHENLAHHYTQPRTDQTLFGSSNTSTDSSGSHRRTPPDEETANFESPMEVVQHVPTFSGNVVSSTDCSLGLLSAAGDGFQDELEEFFSRFINRLPLAWSRPLLRALTLQIATENVPARILTVAAIFDLYDDIKGELLGQLRVAQKEAIMSAAAVGGGDNPPGRATSETTADLLSTTQAPGGARPAVTSHGPLLWPDTPQLATEEATPAPPTLDLYRMYSVAPSILRYRFNSLREAMYTDMFNQYEVAIRRQEEQEERGAVIPEDSRITMPSRQEIVNCLARPHPKDDVLFGAYLVQGAIRCMEPGAHLLRTSGGDDAPARSRTTTPPHHTHHSHHGSYSLNSYQSRNPGDGEWTSVQDGALSRSTSAPAFVSVSYESMPSIFLKGAVDLQLHLSRQHGASLQTISRGAMRPRHAFFTREFVATMACGGDASCLFATTFMPEFLVGLTTFMENPARAVRSAIRATLHRLNVLLAAEIVRTLNPPLHISEHIRAPPLDLAVLYLRENDLYVANTTGLESKLFFITNSVGAERLVLDLDDEYSANSIAGSPNRRHLGDGGVHNGALGEGSLSMASSYSSMASMVGGTTFDMPTLTRSHVDISFLCTQVVAGPRHGGEGANASAVALFYHSCRGGLSRTTVPMVSGDYHRARRSRHHEGESTTEPLLPLVVLMATTEFWSVTPAHFVSDLLRVLVLLNEEAMMFPHGGLVALQSEKHLRGTSAWTNAMECEYVARSERMAHVLSYITHDLAEVFEADVRERLCDYFRHRVEHFRELDTRNVQTMPEKLREKLEQAAAARLATQQNGASDGSLHSTVPGMTDSSTGCGGGGVGGNPSENVHARRVCDAIAAALITEAKVLAARAASDDHTASEEVDLTISEEVDSTYSATRILLGDVTAGSLGELTGISSSSRRQSSTSASGGARRHPNSTKQPAQHAARSQPFSVSVLIIPSAPISTRSTSRRR